MRAPAPRRRAMRPGQPNERGTDPGSRHSGRFWLLACATGAASGLAGVALLRLLRAVERVAWTGAPTFLEAVRATSSAHRLVVVTAAGVLVALVAIPARRRSGRHSGGLTTTIWFESGRFRVGATLLDAVLSIVVVGLGASLGREGALKKTGATIGSWLSGWERLTPTEQRLLAACGAAAGFAAAYDLPFGGALFALEVLLGTLSLQLAAPVMVASVLAAGVRRLLLGSGPTYVVPAWATGGSLLAWSALAGPLLGAAAVLFVRAFHRLDSIGAAGWRRVAFPVAVLAGLGATSAVFPELLGNGKDIVQEALLGRVALPLLVALPVLKVLAVGLCAGSGVPGGLFTPTLSVGSLLGALLGAAWLRVAPGTPPGAFALVGMAALLSGASHGPVSAVVLVLELTGDLRLLPALVLASAASVAVARALDPRSIYTVRLWDGFRAAVEAPPRSASGPVAARLTDDVPRIPSAARYGRLASALLRLRPGEALWVIDDRGRLLGSITAPLPPDAPGDLPRSSLVAGDVAAPPPETVAAAASAAELDAALRRSDGRAVPVVDREGRLLGVVAER